MVTGQIVPVQYVTSLKYHRMTAVSFELRGLRRGRMLTGVLNDEKLRRLIDFNSHM